MKTKIAISAGFLIVFVVATSVACSSSSYSTAQPGSLQGVNPTTIKIVDADWQIEGKRAAHGMRAQQIGLDADQVPIATRIVQDGLDTGPLLDQHRQRQAADARAGPLSVGNTDRLRAARRGSDTGRSAGRSSPLDRC